MNQLSSLVWAATEDELSLAKISICDRNGVGPRIRRSV